MAGASNDVGLTGVVFLRDIETHSAATAPDVTEAGDDGSVTVRVKSNRPLSDDEARLVKDRLLDG